MTPGDRRIDRQAEAAEWSVRRREGLTRTERSDLSDWLTRDAAHPAELEASDRAWDELAGMDLRALDARIGGRTPAARRTAGRVWAAAAAVALAMVLVTAALYLPGGRAYATERGEVRTVRLADGSNVTLGAASKIVVRLEDGRRRVELRRGEAMFDVAHDATRPFLVRAGDAEVTVLGTRFVVKSAPDRVRVDVISGVVRVAKAESPLIAPFIRNAAVGERIVRGERLESPRGADLKVFASVDPADAAPWMQGRLVYEDASLAEVVDDLNRYASADVALASDELGALRVTAALRRDQVPAFLDTLSVTLPVRVERADDGRLLIRSAGG